jgi:hypothetical protein
VPLLYTFVRLQQRKTRNDASPLMLMSLFSNKSFRAGLVLSMVFFAGIPSFFFTFGLYLQLGLGFSPLHAGLTSFPFALASGFASSRSDMLAKKLGTGVLRLGAVSLAVGMAINIVVLHLAGTDLKSWEIGPFLLISGFGLGCFIAPLTNLILAGIKGREAGSASGVLTTGQQVGGALGVALIGIVFFGLLSGNASAAAKEQGAKLQASLTAAHLPPAAVTAAVSQFEDCFTKRTKSKDPSQTPPGCEVPKSAPAAVSRAFATAGTQGQKDDFLHAIERTLFFEVGVFVVAALLVGFVPKVDPGQLGQGPPSAE